MAKGKGKKKEHSNAEKPISLKPLEFDEAVNDLLQIPPKPHKGSNSKQRQEKKFKEPEAS